MTTLHLTPSLELTTEHAASSFGMPVLINRVDRDTAYGPGDILTAYREVQPAACFVARFGKHLEGEARQFARTFLQQWPEGPQLP